MSVSRVSVRASALPRSLLALIAAVALLLAAGAPFASADDGGIAVLVPAARTECFYEMVPHVGIKTFLHYMVTSGGALDIEVEIHDPEGKLTWKSGRESENRVLFKSTHAGRYRFCFSNAMSTVTPKIVALSVLVGDGSNDAGGTGEGPAGPKDSLRSSINRIQQGLREIEEIQNYLRAREREHRATTEVANTRVVVWSILEIVAIVGMGFANVYYLKKMFNTKRMV